MLDSVAAFMSGIIDYAGLFPPAKLDLDTAIRNFVRYRQGESAHMVARFVIPAVRLPELERYHDELFSQGDEPYQFSVLTRSGGHRDAFIEGVEADLEEIRTFRERHGERVVVDAMEIRLSPDLAEQVPEAELRGGLDEVADRVERVVPGGAQLFFEAGLPESWPGRTSLVVDAIAAHNATRLGRRRAGLKLRCGGLEPSAFPSLHRVAITLSACVLARVPFKATAGLHHPLRHHNDSVRTKMHGFLNVFGAGMLMHAGVISSLQLEEVLADESPESFRFEHDGFAWKDKRVGLMPMTRARKNALLSFGSCSVDEPREDLQQLGLL